MSFSFQALVAAKQIAVGQCHGKLIRESDVPHRHAYELLPFRKGGE